jgi:hypothetical protein
MNMVRLLTAMLFVWGVPLAGLFAQSVNIELLNPIYISGRKSGDPNRIFVIHHNECGEAGPRGTYIQVELCNNSGSQLTGLELALNLEKISSLSPDSFFLPNQQPNVQRIGNNGILDDGDCHGAYFFTGYPCTDGEQVELTFQLTTHGTPISLNVLDPEGAMPYTVQTEIHNSSSFGCTTLFGEFPDSTWVGQMIPLAVGYCFGGVSKTHDVIQFQPVGNQNFNAGSYQLAGLQIDTIHNHKGDMWIRDYIDAVPPLDTFPLIVTD